MNRHVLSILVENHSGVLSRITGLFSRRGYNIDSLSVGVTENPKFSRITIVTKGDDQIVEQIRRQLDKLVDVVEITDLHTTKSVYRELMLIKIKVSAKMRSEAIGIADIFRANIVDVTQDSITIEITGDQSKISAFEELVSPFGIIEIARTGLTALERGSKGLKEYNSKESYDII